MYRRNNKPEREKYEGICTFFVLITKHKTGIERVFSCWVVQTGLLHDMSKYSWTEFRVGCRYYQGTRSPNNAEREEKGVFFRMAPPQRQEQTPL